LAMLEDVLDLGRHVEGDLGMRRMERAGDGHGVAHAVEEVGVAEREVPRAGGDLLMGVGEDDLARDDEEAALVDRRDRTVETAMEAAAARLEVSDDALLPRRRADEASITRERREAVPARGDEGQPLEHRRRPQGPAGGRAPSEAIPRGDTGDVARRDAG